MRFAMIDRIAKVTPGEQITATRSLSLAEEYLADHFPQFPVMPGVLTLQACLEAAAWLVRVTNDFTANHVELRSLKALKYGNFVEPGDTLEITVQITTARSTEAGKWKEYELKLQGSVGGRSAVSGKATVRETPMRDAFLRSHREGNLCNTGATDSERNAGGFGTTETNSYATKTTTDDDRAAPQIRDHFLRNFRLLFPRSLSSIKSAESR
jgi:3-hydroxymyristoyl/3-hydroxydecanoyl-(acyl carrier protein) dehydratases